jgi:hypothetical protein
MSQPPLLPRVIARILDLLRGRAPVRVPALAPLPAAGARRRRQARAG